MACITLPDHVRMLATGETFQFGCHPGVPCFTQCCRELELDLTPYDVLRLRQGLKISSHDFFDRFAIIEQEPHDAYPHVFLGMVDDGKASCPFVSAAGCSVYHDRPGACRTYPAGRASRLTRNGTSEFHVLISEPHCRGFEEKNSFTAQEWFADQELDSFNAMNDAVMQIMHHPMIHAGLRIEDSSAEKFLLALYRLDDFKSMLASSALPPALAELKQRACGSSDDEELLKFGVKWLRHELFNEIPDAL